MQLSPPPLSPSEDCLVVIVSPRRSRRSGWRLLGKEEHPEEGEDSTARKGGKGSVSRRGSEGVETVEIGSKRGNDSELAIVVLSSEKSRLLSSLPDEGKKKSESEAEAETETEEEKAGIKNTSKEVKTERREKKR